MKLGRISRGVLSLSKFLGKIIRLTPEMLFARKQGLRIFKSQLRQNGLDEGAVLELTKVYKELGKVNNWLNIHKNLKD